MMKGARVRSARENSLSLRLLSYAAPAVAAALFAAWLVLGLLFERHSERQLQADLQRDAVALIAALELDAAGRPHVMRQPSDPRFTRPASGLYWRISGGGEDYRSRSLWDGTWPAKLRPAPSDRWISFTAKGPFEPEILGIARTVHPDANGPALRVDVASDRRLVREASAAFGKESAMFMGLLWALLSAAAWIQVKLGLRPLRGVRDQLASMAQSPEARLPLQDHVVEIRPLTAAINDLAENRQQDITRARQRARDLAHALKTPITALRLQIDNLDEVQGPAMKQSLALLTGAVEGELARTGASSGAANSTPAPLADRLIAVIARTPDGQRLGFENELPADLSLPLSIEALSETLGALIENAARHAVSQVKVSGGRDANGCWLSIADDGAGIAPHLRAAALGRGVRLDERGSRHGLGLSIAQDFVMASGGEFELETADIGGLDVRATWPAQPAA